jgi:hypothetical protein
MHERYWMPIMSGWRVLPRFKCIDGRKSRRYLGGNECTETGEKFPFVMGEFILNGLLADLDERVGLGTESQCECDFSVM